MLTAKLKFLYIIFSGAIVNVSGETGTKIIVSNTTRYATDCNHCLD